MPPQAERLARIDINKLLTTARWQVFDSKDANIQAACGVAIREFPLIKRQRHLFCNTTRPSQIERIDADSFDFLTVDNSCND
jgi:hypothetical protein